MRFTTWHFVRQVITLELPGVDIKAGPPQQAGQRLNLAIAAVIDQNLVRLCIIHKFILDRFWTLRREFP